jgi:hypothetical protein
VRDAEGNVIAMVDPITGKMLAIIEPAAPTQASNANKTAAAPVR